MIVSIFKISAFSLLITLLLISCNDNSDFQDADSIVTDFDGNVYETVILGNQVWLKQNLRTTHYRNGDPIKLSASESEWWSNAEGAYCYYNNQKNDVDTFGCLYNYLAVNDKRNICPEGWHIPTVAEWDSLAKYLVQNKYGFNGDGGDIAKSLATTFGWSDKNTTSSAVGHRQELNNISGFSAPPAGQRTLFCVFQDRGKISAFWTSNPYNSYNAYFQSINYNYNYITRYIEHFNTGFSVRCIKDK